MSRLCTVGLALAALGLAAPAHAHDVGVGVLSAVEGPPGTYTFAWTAPVDALAAPADVTIHFPAHCTRDGETLTCGPDGLHGIIRFEGVHGAPMQIMVVVRARDGEVLERLATGERPSVDLGGGPGRSALGWVRIGVEHILGGLDHLAFVVGMLLVVGHHARRLAATITAFTVAHSVTLALALLDVLRLPSAPVEATIAASVVLLARESLGGDAHGGDPLGRSATWTRSHPWWVAGGFGLVHGLGFAGALEELGLPRDAVGFALAFFNVGIELGQILIVIVVVLVARLGRRWDLETKCRAPLAYGLGALGVYWLIGRALPLLVGSGAAGG